jgi:predicted RNA binding protein YcfA (HicA-like mRNA interferase family)
LPDNKRRQKRRRKLEQNSKNVRFEDLRRLLEDYGFELKRTKGSHHSFVGYVGQEKFTMVIPFRKPLQEVYVKNALRILNEIEPLDEDEEATEGETPDDEQNT